MRMKFQNYLMLIIYTIIYSNVIRLFMQRSRTTLIVRIHSRLSTQMHWQFQLEHFFCTREPISGIGEWLTFQPGTKSSRTRLRYRTNPINRSLFSLWGRDRSLRVREREREREFSEKLATLGLRITCNSTNSYETRLFSRRLLQFYRTNW